MSTLKKIAKYILLVIAIYLLTMFLTFVGFNVNYSEITLIGDLPDQITIAKAEATKSDGRIYGYVSNSKDNNVNGKYIQILVYNSDNELLTTEYLRIEGVSYGEEKLFRSTFTVDNAYSYSIDIVDDDSGEQSETQIENDESGEQSES